MSEGEGRWVRLGHSGLAPSLKQYLMHWSGSHPTRAWNLCAPQASKYNVVRPTK
jgi:hypothetical protein